MKHLTRNKVDNSVMARIMRAGVKYQKRFPLSRYDGSWEDAEKAGKIWLDDLMKTLPPCEMNKPGRLTHRNQSGVVGISLAYKKVTKKSGKEYEYWSWISKWAGCERKGGVAWHVGANHSDDDAFVLAVLSREMQSVDKERVMAKFRRIRGRRSHKEILAKKALMLV